MDAMRYGLVDVALGVLTSNWEGFGSQAEVIKAVELLHGGEIVRLAIKAPAEVMPDGMREIPDGDFAKLPLLQCIVTRAETSVLFMVHGEFARTE